MNKVKTVRIQQRDGTYSAEIPIAAESINVTMADGSNVQDKIATLQSQISSLTALEQGSTTGDAQLLDIRLKTDGTTADTAGNAVRQQFYALQNTVDDGLQTILDVATDSNNRATQAYGIASNAENHMASLDNQIREIQSALQDVSIDVDDLGLEQDPDTYYVYPTYKGIRSENGIPLAGGGGGGGGTGPDVISAILTAENTSGWLSKTIPAGSSCPISFVWSSTEDGMSTGDGSVRITVNEIVRSTMQIKQGNVSLDLAPYLTTGTNKVKVRISDTYDQGKTITFNITTIALSISSSFDSTRAYNSSIIFPYTPVGATEKTIYFYLDGSLIGTQVTAVSGRQMTFMIETLNHGSHSLRVYFTAEINNETVTSNELYYEFIYIQPLNNSIIIASSFNQSVVQQYSLVPIPFQVYNPADLESEVTISVNDQIVSTQTVSRSEQTYTYRANIPGDIVVKIASRQVTKTINFTVEESSIEINPETDALALYLSSVGRSNNEEHPEKWEYGTGNKAIKATLSNFNFTSDGWQTDADGATCLRVSGPARVTIPYKPFQVDFRSTGKTIELEFATRNVLDYDAVILSCMSGGRGIQLTPQRAILISQQSEISTQYKEDEHVRIAFVVQKISENRLLLIYINGIPSGVVQYSSDDDFSQIEPVNINIGSDNCAVDFYTIRIYDNSLNGNQILDNWIADTPNGTVMLQRYTRNTVYDAYGKIVPANLPADLPYFILNAAELPQYKGDKKTISGSYINRMYPSKSFTFTGCQINVQGTSSAVYVRKNYDLQFKNGFEMNSGNHASNYLLQEGNIPFNRFVLKADVASSEGANNVELVRLYNDACPYKTPEMEEDSRVRWGIDGFPIVVFWNNTETQQLSFLGKYNFNLPKRAPGPYGYANDDTLESWEFQNNTSNLMIFKTDYFDETMYTDPDTGDTKELWRYDYEARFPSDEYTDYTLLQELESFVYSTYRENATGDALDSPVTYNNVEYTTDSAAYRLAKFKADFPTYAELDTFLFYYIFTELFLMVDSRAKNLFIGFNGSPVTVAGRHAVRKATAQPYDMDTAIGTNNEGTLVFGYSLEDTDHLTGNVNIFNGQESVLWCNLRDAFETQIRQMYQSLRSTGIISYSTIEQRFENHQAKWPEAIWIEDSRFKYIDPLTNPDPGKEPTADYLSMMQGSKAEQRKWWLFNRFKYMDSKWNAGDALAQVIILRGYAKANITVTPYTDIYPTIKYASYVVQERGVHGQPTTLVCPLDQVSDTEISIYSAPQLASVGDLAPLKVGFANFSSAVNLQEIKIGDSSNSYNNSNLYTLTLGNNILLKKLDVRNCSGLGDTSMTGHTQTTVDISNCSIIEEIYFDGTKIQGVTLPNGGNIKKLHLPNTITNLTILNQKNINELVIAGYDNISTLRLENSSIDYRTILEAIPAGSRVRLIGFEWEAEDAEQIEEILAILNSMRGLDEAGNNMDKAQVMGTIHTGSLTGAQIAAYNEEYPYLRITADHTTSNLRYYNYDGTELLYTEEIQDGGDGHLYTGQPSRAATAQYTFTFIGWSTQKNSYAVDVDALIHVVADRNVYAAYNVVGQTYRVRFFNGSTLLQTYNNVLYGDSVYYTGETPEYNGSEMGEFEFNGFSPSGLNIQANTDCYAQYTDVSSVVVQYLKGTLRRYESSTNTDKIGEYGLAHLDNLESVEAPVTKIESYGFANDPKLKTVDLTNVNEEITIASSSFNFSYQLEFFIIRSRLIANLSTSLSNLKIGKGIGGIYVPSNLVSSYKSATNWSNYADNIYSINDYPITDYSTIQDSWEQIFASQQDGTYSTKYQIGDTKKISFNGYDVYMEIIAFDTDELADNSGTAKITWVSKFMYESRKILDDNQNREETDWEESYLRNWFHTDGLESINLIVQNNIKEVTKTYLNFNGETLQSVDKIWLLSARQVNLSGSIENYGCQYSSFNKSRFTLINNILGSSSSMCITRSQIEGTSMNDKGCFRIFNGGTTSTNIIGYYIFGFCT